MNLKKKMKLCAHCDGEVDLDVVVCPYCGSNLEVISKSLPPKKNLEDPLSSLYPPPYQPKTVEPIAKTVDEEFENEKKPSLLIPTLIFSLGVNILLFGIYLLFFSRGGELFLHFNAELWFVYLLLGAPLSYLGYKMLSKIF